MAEAFLLDTSAIMAFIEDEPGADQVQSILLAADDGSLSLYGCFVSLTEVEYITRQEQGEIIAERRLRDLRNLPVQWIHSDSDGENKGDTHLFRQRRKKHLAYAAAGRPEACLIV